MPDYYNTYDPINVAASYIASAMERLEAMVVFLSLDSNAVATIMNDLEKALEALNKTDLDELDYDEFMEIIGEHSSDDYNDPFKGLDDEARESEEMRKMLGEMRRMRDEIAALRSGAQQPQPQQQNDFSQSQQGFSQDGYASGYPGYAQQQMPTPTQMQGSQQGQYPQAGQGYPLQGQGRMPSDQQGFVQQGFQQQMQQQQQQPQFMPQQQQGQMPMQAQQQRQPQQPQQPQFCFWYSLLTNLPPEQQMRVAVMSQQEQGVIAQQAFLQLQQAGTVDAAILEKCRPVLLSNPIPYNGPLPPDFQPTPAQQQVFANQQARQEQVMDEQAHVNHQQVDQRQQARQAAQAVQAQQQAATQRQAAAQQRGTKAASMPSIEEAAALRDKQDQMNRQQKKRATASGANAAVLPGSSSGTTKVSPSADDEFDMVHIPFTAAEFDINAEGTTSSMYVECWDKSIGEWDVGTLLSDDALNVSEFSIYGMLADGTLVDVLWTAADKTVTASVQAAHRIGVLTEATQGTQRQSMVRAGVPNPSAILEEAIARTAAEALSYLTEIDILTITLDIEYAETEYTLFFADKSADIEIEWVQEEGVTAETLGYLILHLSNVLNEYAVLKSGDKKQWIGERPSSTKAAWYHTHKQTYQVDVSRARTGTKMILNLSAISVNEDGQLTIRNFS